MSEKIYKFIDGVQYELSESEMVEYSENQLLQAGLVAEWEAQAYARKRQQEYPSMGDQLDALWKGGAAADAMLEKIQAVKTKYPKPTGN
jgi:hypothetical protein